MLNSAYAIPKSTHERRESIYADRFYVLDGRWSNTYGKDRTRRVVGGLKARLERPYVLREMRPGEWREYFIEDGHLPGHQPRVSEAQAIEWLRANKWGSIVPIPNF